MCLSSVLSVLQYSETLARAGFMGTDPCNQMAPHLVFCTGVAILSISTELKFCKWSPFGWWNIHMQKGDIHSFLSSHSHIVFGLPPEHRISMAAIMRDHPGRLKASTKKAYDCCYWVRWERGRCWHPKGRALCSNQNKDQGTLSVLY